MLFCPIKIYEAFKLVSVSWYWFKFLSWFTCTIFTLDANVKSKLIISRVKVI